MRAALGYRMTRASLEVMLFKVGEELFGVDLSRIEGVVRGMPPRSEATGRLWFKGQEIPVYCAPELLPGRRPHAGGREALILRDDSGLFALTVDGTEGVVEITGGNDLYTFPPKPGADTWPCRPWGVWDSGSRMVLLLDFTSTTVQ